MNALPPGLLRRLRGLGVGVGLVDEDTAVLHGVPANEGYYSRGRTNLLVKRPRGGTQFVVGVDEDLEYEGAEGPLATAFRNGVVLSGWRVLLIDLRPVGGDREDELVRVVEKALAALGSDGKTPTLEMPEDAREAETAPRLGESLTARVGAGSAEPTVGRADEIESVLTCALQWGARRLALIVGESGVGKTNLLHGIAARLAERHPARDLVRLDLGRHLSGCLFPAERERLLVRLFEEARESGRTILAVERAELALEAPFGPFLLAHALDEGTRVIATSSPEGAEAFGADAVALRIRRLSLREPTPSETVEILAAVAPRLAEHHGISAPGEEVLRSCVRASRDLCGRMPARAIALLDAAASRAALAGRDRIQADEIYHEAAPGP